MPGIFGTTGCTSKVFDTLEDYYIKIWGGQSCERHTREWSALGGHSFGEVPAVHANEQHSFAVDGTPSLYEAADLSSQSGNEDVFRYSSSGFIELDRQVVGNVAVLQSASRTLHLGADWSGAFPLYYSRWQSGIVFANLLKPLADLTRADLDPMGLLQYLRQGAIYGNRTPFAGIQRLRPGEVIRFDLDSQQLSHRDRSQLWSGEPETDAQQIVEQCIFRLSEVLETTSRLTVPAIMMSGGWDSRTMLAACGRLSNDGTRTRYSGYSHGDVEGRELKLVQRLCDEAGIPCHLEPIGPSVLDLSSIRDGFAKTGSANFPHWHQSGHVLDELGMDCAVAGVFGEILGGHYGRTMSARGLGKGFALVREWLTDADIDTPDKPVEAAWRVLRLENVTTQDHWYLDEGFERSIPDKESRINAAIKSALSRLHDRGIWRSERLIEAFISEHRGSQYIAGQTVSIRTSVDADVPFADRELLEVASRIPAGAKIHNAVNRAMLERLDSSLLDLPMAATLVRASAPMPLQEVSRAVRKVWETAGWKTYFATGRMTPPPRLGWVNFEFLREGQRLQDLVDDLRADLWNRDALRTRVEQVVTGDYDSRLHPLFDQLSQIFTIDLLLRR